MDYVFGKLEDGSSGCGIFTGNSGFAGANRLIGDYSASSPNHHCAFIDIGVSYFGKFADSYYRQDVKNTLNPPNKYSDDDPYHSDSSFYRSDCIYCQPLIYIWNEEQKMFEERKAEYK